MKESNLFTFKGKSNRHLNIRIGYDFILELRDLEEKEELEKNLIDGYRCIPVRIRKTEIDSDISCKIEEEELEKINRSLLISGATNCPLIYRNSCLLGYFTKGSNWLKHYKDGYINLFFNCEPYVYNKAWGGHYNTKVVDSLKNIDIEVIGDYDLISTINVGFWNNETGNLKITNITTGEVKTYNNITVAKNLECVKLNIGKNNIKIETNKRATVDFIHKEMFNIERKLEEWAK